MAESFSRLRYTGDEVLALFDTEGEDGGLDDTFFPGSDEELGFLEDDSDEEEEETTGQQK